MITRRHMITGIAATALLTGLPAAGRGQSRGQGRGRVPAGALQVETGPAFGSAWRLVLAPSQDAGAARKVIERVVDQVDRRMSPFRKNSELSRFNSLAAPLSPLRLSAETAGVVAQALEIAAASDGAFDPTCAPMGRRYGFGPTLISANRPAGRYGDIELVGRNLVARVAHLSLDLCAIAKGHALQQIVQDLDGLEFVLELGGEVAARGRHPSGRRWRLGIERPGGQALQRVINAGTEVLATSANDLQGYRVFGTSYGHVVDPRRGKPVANEVASVSVLAPSGQLADALATAALVLGPERAAAPLKSYQARALFLVRKGQALEEIDLFGFTRERTG